VLVRHRMLIFVAKIMWSTAHAPQNVYFGAPQKRFSLLVLVRSYPRHAHQFRRVYSTRSPISRRSCNRNQQKKNLPEKTTCRSLTVVDAAPWSILCRGRCCAVIDVVPWSMLCVATSRARPAIQAKTFPRGSGAGRTAFNTTSLAATC
jgi:hypothetical protein